MADSGAEKTEKATPKKRRDAREKGQVRKSNEVNVALCCVVMFGMLIIIWPSYVEKLIGIYKENLNDSAILVFKSAVDNNEVMSAFIRAAYSGASILLPIFGVALVVGIGANLLQIGFLFSTKPIQPKLEKISPIKGFKRIFSSRTIMELLKSILKVLVLGYIAYSEYTKLLPGFPTLIGKNLFETFMFIMDTALKLGLKMCLALVAIALADYIFQWRKYEKDLRMTKQEVKDEYKLMEGDPQIKGKIRQKQRQMSSMRMISQVPSADVVITNPTHFAVALKYEDKVDVAPIVVAKGKDYLARKIKEKARESGVEIVENKELAQAIYAYCEVDDMIPQELYQAVADILVYVYRQKHPERRSTGRGGKR